MERSHLSNSYKSKEATVFFDSTKTSQGCTDELVLFYYTTCIRPILEYACPVFHDSLPQYLSHDVEMIQKRALRIIHPRIPYSDALSLTGLKLLSKRRDNLKSKHFQGIIMDENHKLHEFIPPRNTRVTDLRIKHKLNINFCANRFKSSFSVIANSLKF